MQLNFDFMQMESELKNSSKNKLDRSDRKFHDWYRFVLSYPPHLVRHYINEFNLTSEDILLDPFCGTGTTLVEAKLNGIPSIGIEADAFPHFACLTKTNWDIDVFTLRQTAENIRQKAIDLLSKQGVSDEPSEKNLQAKNLKGLTETQEKLVLKTSGFERLYHKVTTLYFGGMAKHLLELQPFLKSGAYLAYVVGDQASYLRTMIRTGNLLGQIAESLGYELVKIDLFRTRFSTATKSDLNEEVLILR